MFYVDLWNAKFEKKNLYKKYINSMLNSFLGNDIQNYHELY